MSPWIMSLALREIEQNETLCEGLVVFSILIYGGGDWI